MDAESYIRRLVDERVADFARREEAADQEGGYDALRELSVAAMSLVSTGALDRRFAEEAVGQMRASLVSLGVVTPDTIAPAPFGDAPPVGPADWGSPSAVSPPHLLRVLPVAKDLGPLDGGAAVTLISLEVWSDHLRLRYAMTARRNLDARRPERWACTLGDDAGTVYLRGGGQGGGGSDVWYEETEFRPVPPPEATKVIFTARRLGSPRDEPRSDLPWTGEGPLGEEIVSVEIPLG
jgi:hypothetical protein